MNHLIADLLFRRLQTIANVCLFVSANVAGVFTHYPTEVAQRAAFTETRRCMKSRLAIQKESQEQVGAQWSRCVHSRTSQRWQ